MSRKPVFKIAVAALILGLGLLFNQSSAYAESTATVSVESAFIRSSASTSGSTVASAMKNDKLTIIESTTDSAGNTWYKVQVDGTTTGYIRADLVTLSGDTPASSASTTTQTSTSTASTVEIGGTPIVSDSLVEVEPVTGKTTSGVNVRKGPSTTTSAIDNIASGTSVTVTGYEEASDGKWYYLTYGTKMGYIRSDFVKLDGELTVVSDEPAVEPEPTDEPVASVDPEPTPEPVYEDYEVKYEADENGDYYWYLYDYTEGTKTVITDLTAAKKTFETTKATYEKKLKKKQVGIVVLSIFLILAIAVIVAAAVLFLRYFDFGTVTEETVKAKPVTSDSFGTRKRRKLDDEDDEEDDEEPVKETKPAPKPAQPAQSAQNASKVDTTGAVISADRQYLIYPDGTRKRIQVKPREEAQTPAAPETRTQEKQVRNFMDDDDDDIETKFLPHASRRDDKE